MSEGDIFGFAGLAVLVATMVVWFRMVNQVSVPQNRMPYFGAFLVGSAFGIYAFVLGTSWIGGIPAGIAAFAGIFFVGMRALSAQDARTPAVQVGGSIIDFQAPDENDELFDLATMRGKPFLLKFFRGHW